MVVEVGPHGPRISPPPQPTRRPLQGILGRGKTLGAAQHGGAEAEGEEQKVASGALAQRRREPRRQPPQLRNLNLPDVLLQLFLLSFLIPILSLLERHNLAFESAPLLYAFVKQGGELLDSLFELCDLLLQLVYTLSRGQEIVIRTSKRLRKSIGR